MKQLQLNINASTHLSNQQFYRNQMPKDQYCSNKTISINVNKSKSLMNQIAQNNKIMRDSHNHLLFRQTQKETKNLINQKQFVEYNKHCQYELKGKIHNKNMVLENDKYKNYQVYSINNLFLAENGNKFKNKKVKRNNKGSLDHYKYFKANKLQEYQQVQKDLDKSDLSVKPQVKQYLDLDLSSSQIYKDHVKHHDSSYIHNSSNSAININAKTHFHKSDNNSILDEINSPKNGYKKYNIIKFGDKDDISNKSINQSQFQRLNSIRKIEEKVFVKLYQQQFQLVSSQMELESNKEINQNKEIQLKQLLLTNYLQTNQQQQIIIQQLLQTEKIELKLFMNSFKLFQINTRNTNFRILKGIDVDINHASEIDQMIISKKTVLKFNKILLQVQATHSENVFFILKFLFIGENQISVNELQSIIEEIIEKVKNNKLREKIKDQIINHNCYQKIIDKETNLDITFVRQILSNKKSESFLLNIILLLIYKNKKV